MIKRWCILMSGHLLWWREREIGLSWRPLILLPVQVHINLSVWYQRCSNYNNSRIRWLWGWYFAWLRNWFTLTKQSDTERVENNQFVVQAKKIFDLPVNKSRIKIFNFLKWKFVVKTNMLSASVISLCIHPLVRV